MARPGRLVGYRIGDRIYAPEDVEIVRHASGPPWWRWFEPPRWWPGWLHKLTCTWCRGMRRYAREVRRG